MPLVTRQTTQANLFRQAVEPPNWLNGDMWIDTDNANVAVNRSGTAQRIAPGTTAAGDILFSNGADTVDNLAIGTAGQALLVNSGATAVEWGSGGITEQAEASSTPITDDDEATLADGQLLLSNQITLPTTEKYYKITAIECKNGTAVSGNIVLGVCMVDSDPPVGTELLMIAYTPKTAQTGTSAVQKISVQSSLLIVGGAKLTGMILLDNTTGTIRFDTISTQNGIKTGFGNVSPPVPFDDTIAWSTTEAHGYVKIYFKGYS